MKERQITDTEKLFLQLLQLALGTKEQWDVLPSDEQWPEFYRLAVKHCVVGICVPALDACPLELKLLWMGRAEQTADRNHVIDAQCRQLCDKLTKSGYWNCILKGQGIAQLYPYPQWRQSGDIDVWVDSSRRRLVEMARRISGCRDEVMYHHVEFRVFEDTLVEIHFTPSWMFSWLHNHRLQRWFKQQREHADFPTTLGFPTPNIEFNVVFCLVHVFRHVFDEGIGLRQIIDYFYVLKAAHPVPGEYKKILRSLGLYQFAQALMWVMQDSLGLPEEWMIAEPDERKGRWLLSEILQAGNFGRYDERNDRVGHRGRVERIFWRIMVTSRRMRMFPREAMAEMPWRVWHYFWRVCHGYL